MKRKKIMILFLIFAMVLSLGACSGGCGKKDGPVGPGPDNPGIDEGEPVTVEELLGNWVVEYVSAVDGTNKVKVADSYAIFAEEEAKYFFQGALLYDCTYIWADERSLLMTSKADSNVKFGWSLEKVSEDEIVITDRINFAKYYLKKAGDINLAELEVNKITAEELAGVWEMYQMVSNGTKKPMYDAFLFFTTNTMQYIVDGMVKTDNKYTFMDDQTINLISKINGSTLPWTVYTNGNGDLICSDASGNSYHCRRSTKLQGVSGLKGTYSLYAWCLADGTSYTPVQENYLQFEDGKMKFYVNGVKTTESTIRKMDTIRWHLTDTSDSSNQNDWYFISQGNYIAVSDPLSYLVYYVRKVSDIDFDANSVDIDPASILGNWKVVKWDINGTTYTDADVNLGWNITDTNCDFISNGAPATVNTYSLDGQVLTLKAGGGTAACILSFDEEGRFVMDCTPWGYGVMTCVKADPVQPEDPEDPVDPDETLDLTGTWNMDSWEGIGALAGYSGELTGNVLVFTDTEMTYYINDVVTTDNTYTLDGENLNLTDKTDETKTAVWVVEETETGIKITDAASSMIYYCTKVEEPIVLTGTWNMDSWEGIGALTGYSGELTGNILVFTDTEMTYYVNDVVTTDNTYTFDGENLNLTDKTDETKTAVWVVEETETGIKITDAASSLIYYCTKVEEDITGNWKVVKWEVSGATYTDADVDMAWVITDTNCDFYSNGAAATVNTYAVENGVLTLTNEAGSSVDCGLSFTEDGKLVLDCTSWGYGVMTCEKQTAIDPETPVEPEEPVLDKADLLGTWLVESWAAPDGNTYDGTTYPHGWVITETNCDYYTAGTLTTPNTYEIDGMNIVLSGTAVTPAALGEDGKLTLDCSSWGFGVMTCVKYVPETPAEPEEPVEPEEPRLTKEKLEGTWLVSSWAAPDGNTYDGATVPQGWVITETNCDYYYLGALATQNTYEIDGDDLLLTSAGGTVKTGATFTEGGSLVLDCTSWGYGVMTCEKQ